jgi:hypothetical protein
MSVSEQMQIVVGPEESNHGRIAFVYREVYPLTSFSIVLRITHLTKQLLGEHGGVVS